MKTVLRFDDFNHFDKTFKRYMTDLCRDIASGKTPDQYLQIREVIRDKKD